MSDFNNIVRRFKTKSFSSSDDEDQTNCSSQNVTEISANGSIKGCTSTEKKQTKVN